MLAKQNRFSGNKSLVPVQRAGKFVRAGFFQMRYFVDSKNSNRPFRIAVVVSKKIDKRAVVRNRIRRRVFEAYRSQAQSVPKSVDIMLVVHSVDVASMPFESIKSSLSSMIDRIAR
jgi:ribonuclease P protein component